MPISVRLFRFYTIVLTKILLGCQYMKRITGLDKTRLFKKIPYGKYWQEIDSTDYDTWFQARPDLHRSFVNFLKDKADVRTVLEVGCGNGAYPITLKELFLDKEYEGVDFGSPAIEFCRKHSDFKFHLGDFITMKLDKKYDLVFSHAVIDHVYDIEAFLSKIVQVCNKYAFISSYRGYFPDRKKHVMLWDNQMGCYFNDLSPEEIKKHLLKCGLSADEFVIRGQKGENLQDGIDEETIIEIHRKS